MTSRERTSQERAADALRKRESRAARAAERAAESSAALDMTALVRELVAANRKLAEAQERIVTTVTDLLGRIADVFGRPADVQRTSETSARTSSGVRADSGAGLAGARAETQIPPLSDEDPRDSKTSEGNLKISPRADASDVQRTSENVQQASGPDADASSRPEEDSGVHLSAPLAPASSPALSRPTNATADGAGGLAVSAWAEGIRSVTRKPFSTPRGGSTELVTLIDCMIDHCEDHVVRVEWARAEGRRFAESYKGKLNAYSFKDWLNSKDAETPAPATPPSESPRAREERARRERAMREAEQNRAAPPPEALALARGRPPASIAKAGP